MLKSFVTVENNSNIFDFGYLKKLIFKNNNWIRLKNVNKVIANKILKKRILYYQW